MRVIAVIMCSLALADIAYAQTFSDETARKVWAKYTSCAAARNKKAEQYFLAKSEECMKQSPAAKLDDCDEVAEIKVSEWRESTEFKLMCESYKPTTYAKKGDALAIDFVGLPGAWLALKDGELSITKKILEECAAVGDPDCVRLVANFKQQGQ